MFLKVFQILKIYNTLFSITKDINMENINNFIDRIILYFASKRKKVFLNNIAYNPKYVKKCFGKSK